MSLRDTARTVLRERDRLFTLASFVTFGLWRADNKSQLKMDSHHRHAAMISTRGASGKAGGSGRPRSPRA